MSTVLLVDDEKNVLKTLSLSLKRHDFTVQQAQTGPDALRLLEREPCDFVVSDIRMTPMDGYKLASAIRKRYPEMPVIFMTAFAGEDAGGLSDRIGDIPKLTKPFPVVDLVRLAHLAGAGTLRLAREDELDWLYPDCERGAMPPLGPLYKQRMFVDQALAAEPEIVFNAGTHADAVRMRYGDFAAMTRPFVGRFAERR